MINRNLNNKYYNLINDFFKKNNWEPLPHQIDSWDSFFRGENGIIQLPTGCGKTYAAFMGPLLKLKEKDIPEGINILVITPLKALSRDLEKSLNKAAKFVDKRITIGIRNGDTSPYEKNKQILKPPNILITTPETLALLIANKNSKKLFNNLFSIIIDEWHELMGNKRGNQCELSLSAIRALKKDIQIWAMSATLGNIYEASRVIVGVKGKYPTIIKSELKKIIELKSIIPKEIGTLPWSGHLGLRSHKYLLEEIEKNKSTLFFTNTRSHSEKWFQCLKFYYPEMGNKIAIHHSSMDKEDRRNVEEGVKNGIIKWVICTSSLDLGVDFQPVEQIVQIGSPKNLARLIQRAGRSSHKPGGKSKLIFMPTNSLELIELSAMRRIIYTDIVEEINLPELSFDVLLQHLISLACGWGFDPKVEKETIKNCWSFRNMKDEEWDWCLNFLENGGECLKAYPKYKKIQKKDQGDNRFKYFVSNNNIKRIHKFNIGTITSDKYIIVKFIKGKTIGNLEENFASRLKSGDAFFFAGRILEYVKLKDMILYVKRSNKKSSIIPSWVGGQIAISNLLSKNIRKEISICNIPESSSKFLNREITSLKPLLDLQRRISNIPKENDLLVELYEGKDFKSLFVFTLEGKFVNEGIAFLLAYRLTKVNKNTFSITSNDFGFSLTTSNKYDFYKIEEQLKDLLSINQLEKDLQSAINFSELTKKRFKKIAQISGLVNNHSPSNLKSPNQLQISSNLLFDVFTKYESNHLLIKQAFQEVNRDDLESLRIKECLKRISNCRLIFNTIEKPTPFSFPLLVERLRNTLSNESIEERVNKLIKSHE